MKRDMDLIRAILIELEKQPADGRLHPITVPGYSDLEIYGHIRLLHEGSFIDAIDSTTNSGVCWKPKRLTWEARRQA